jgi:hypothetical protein
MSQLATRRAARLATVIMTVALTSALVGGAQLARAGASTASDRAQAKKALLVPADLPKGWHQEKGSGSTGSGNFPGASQLAGCIGVPADLIGSNPPEADGPYYENTSGSLEIRDSVSVFPSAKRARAELAAMASTKTPGCMGTIMNGAFKAKVTASAKKGAKLGTIAVTRADPANFGSGTTGVVMALPVRERGVSLTVTITAVYAIKGTFGQQIDFISFAAPFPASISLPVTAAATHHL